MSFNDEYLKLRKKRLEEEETRRDNTNQNKVYLDTLFPDASSDIAPVRLTEQEQQMGTTDERKWFEKGAFEDGYQFGDLTKTILGTSKDAETNIMTGIVGMGEKVVDALAAIAPYVSQAQWNMNGGDFTAFTNPQVAKDFKEANEQSKTELQKFVEQDLYDEEEVARKIVTARSPLAWFDKSVMDESNSVLGEKSDALVQSGGQLVGTMALQAVGVPWYLTTGVTTFGSEAESAFKQGASYDEAALSATISAGAEILTEKLSGGISFGGKTLDAGLTNILASNISNKTAQALLKFGIDATGEGFEEVFSNAISAVGQKLTYDRDKDISAKELFLSEEAFENFIGGFVLGGGSNVVGGVKAKAEGTDAVTGLTKDEQKVVDKVFKDAVAEAEEGGKKLSAKQKTDLYNEVVNKLEKGYIDTDTIEEVLGEDVYKSYKDTIDYEDDILKQYEELGKKTNPTLAEMSLFDELKSQYNDIKQNSQREAIKSRLSEEVFGKVKDTKLAESYNEVARRGQVFEADLTGYDTKQQEVIKKAVESGVLNNTNRTHEFVDLIAKISADKGVLFDFTNNAKLKESGFAVDGKEVNGFVTKDGISINIDSHKALQSTVGHEITHVLEGTELYAEMQRALFDYAKSKKDFDGRRTSLAELYKDIDGADIDAELTADLVGDYLFTDEDFVRRLSTEHRNVFQKVWDEIKHLWKMATAGSKEARELEKAMHLFEKVYRESGKTSGKTSEGTKYSLDMVDAVKPTTNKWTQSATTDEVRAAHPTLYAVDETATEERNPTQVKGTVGSYRKVYESLKNEGFNGTILDASSGLGYGTKAGIEEYGFDVEDIEPYPDSDYKPKYTDYSSLNKKYDVVISNAVLNVLPQDQRDALTVKMGELLNPGGRMFVNVRGKDVLNASGKIAINESNMEYFIPRTAKTGSYQKGFTKSELVAYLEDALGDGFTVKPTNMFGAVSAIVTKDGTKYSISDSDGKPIDADRISIDESDTRYSLSHNSEIAKGQMDYIANHKVALSQEELAEAQKVTNAMVDVMMKYSSILPEDKIGKVLTKNGSYDRSVENTTICVRTLAYNEFVDKVQEEIGRPLTQMESFLVSQKLYDIAVDPQCLYCYVSLDRKAFNDMLLRYMQDRDTVIAKYNNSDKSDAAVSKLYEEFLNGRKDTKNMKDRFNKWLSYVDNGTQLLSLADIATEDRQSVIKANGGNLAAQLADARAYAQSASWSKIQKNYVAYRDEILKLGDRVVKNLNEHYGLRWYSFSDYSAAFIVENMQQITDASIRGLKGLSYTKDTDYAEIFAPSGMNINVSVFVNQDANGNFFIDEKQSANFEKALELRERYPNVGIVATVTNDDALRWAASQEWSDVIIPFHIVRTGADVAEYYKWLNYTAESADSVKDSDLWNAYLDSLNLSDGARKKASKNIYPNEHKNDKNTYLNLCESRGLTPRFARFAGEDWYMKLVNETRLSADVSSPLKPIYNLEAAQASFKKFVEKGGYEGGWYKKAINVDAEAKAVAQDVLAGKKANEVDYGRQDAFVPEDLMAGRRINRVHGKHSLSAEGEPQKRYGNYNIYGKDVRYEAPMQEQVAPTQETVSKMETVEGYAPITEEEANALQSDNVDSLTDADVPPEMEAPYYGETQDAAPIDPFEDRDMKEVSRDRKTPAYMYENPEVKPFFQAEANILLGELERVEKPETIYNGWAKYEMSYEFAQDIPEVYRTERIASDTIVYLRDTIGMSYADIEKGLKAIIEDHGAENIAAAKKLEFVINDRLLYGYNDDGGFEIPANQDYINLLTEKEIREYSEEARKQFFEVADAYDPMADIAPVAATTEETSEVPVKEQYEAIKPERKKSTEPRLKRVKDSETSADGKQRKWIGTSTDSEAVDGKVTPDDIPDDMRYYQPIPNKVTLGNANTRLDSMGYDVSLSYFNSQFANKRVSLDDIALGERLIQEAVKRGDTKTASELIQNVSILGTELGQKVQALSIIKRLSPEGQLRMLQKTVERGKTRGDKSFEGVEITQEMIDHILKTYGKDGTYDQTKLNEAVEDVKKKIAKQMKVTKLEKVNAWRYLSMLGNPKTHIRNLVSNVAMQGTVAVKNAVARTIETVAPIENRTKTWKRASDAVKTFSQNTAMEMKDVLSDGGKYSEEASIKANRDTFKNKVLNKVYNFNSDMLSKEDWWFSKPAFTSALSEYLTANGIVTEQDIANNPKIVAKAKQYATEQSQIATFRQYSWLANKINEIEHRNVVTNIAVGAILPFKKTPINIAKTGLNYSPLGFAKTLTYDAAQVKNGKMEASELVDHLSQNITGSALTLVGYLLASSGFLNGAGEDDKEGEYDYQLGEQAYSITIGDATYSLSWLSPIAMPLFVGANAYEQLVEGKEWNGDVVVQTLAQTLDPLSEMSFLSSLDSVLSSYDSGIMKFAGIAQTAAQSYTSQFVPTLSSQVAAVMDDTKRTTKVAGDSTFKAFDEIINNLKYKIPGLRETLEPTTDIWGNEVKQTEDMLTRAFETFIAPYSKRDDIATEIDSEIKSLYGMTGDDGLIPSIPNNYVNYKDEKYKMSAKEYTAYKEAYGQTAYNLLGELFDTETYRYASDEDKAEMVNKVYDYARDVAKQEFLAKKGVTYTNAKEDGEDIYREDNIKGAIEHDMTLDEYTFYHEYPEKYALAKSVGGYEKYKTYSSDLYDIKADKDENGKSITGSRKDKVADYINGLDISYEEKIILFKSEYNADDTYNYEIIDYLNNRNDISYDEMVAILKELGFTVKGDTITWD